MSVEGSDLLAFRGSVCFVLVRPPPPQNRPKPFVDGDTERGQSGPSLPLTAFLRDCEAASQQPY